MDFLSGVFGDPVQPAVKLIILTLILVFVLLVIFWIFRRFVGSPAIKAARGRQPRLAVTDAANLDDKRRLVLVRRDDVEHLVMIGGTTDILIESNIVRIKPVRTPSKPATLEEEIASMPEPSAPPNPTQQVNSQSEISNNDDQNFKTRLAAQTAGIAGVAGAIVGASQAPDENTHQPENSKSTPPEIAISEPGFPDTASFENAPGEIAKDVAQETAQPDFTDAISVAETDPVAPPEYAELNFTPVKQENQVVDGAGEHIPDLNEPKIDEIDVAALSNLEDALGVELSDEQLSAPVAEEVVAPAPAAPTPDTSPPPVVTEGSGVVDEQAAKAKMTKETKPAMEDEMQKLLDELSGGKS